MPARTLAADSLPGQGTSHRPALRVSLPNRVAALGCQGRSQRL